MASSKLRKTDILDIAERLFQQKGFDGTSMSDIQTEAGIARGTLYHHFKSKELILDALIDRYSEKLFAHAKGLAENRQEPVLQRFFQVLSSLNLNRASGLDMTEALHRPQNALLHEKSNQILIARLTPILVGIVEDGLTQGLFDTAYPYQATEMVLIAALNQSLDRKEAVDALIYHMERIFGAKEGSLASIVKDLNLDQTGLEDR